MIIKTGQLRRKGTHKMVIEPYVMKTIGAEELPSVQALQQFVYNKLPNKDVLVTDSFEAMSKDLEEGGIIIGVYNGLNQLIAYRFVTFPKQHENNLGADLHLCATGMEKVAHLETTLVHPAYRGNALQSETLGMAIPIIEAKGYRHILCTVSPVNPHSLYNVMSHGLRIKALKRKYGNDQGNHGLWRFILHRDLAIKKGFRIDDWLNIGLTELETQSKLIQNGFVGTALNREASSLQYVKFATNFY